MKFYLPPVHFHLVHGVERPGPSVGVSEVVVPFEATTFQLQCGVQRGTPDGTINWFHEASILPMGAGKYLTSNDGGTLTVHGVKASTSAGDAGIYQCWVSNAVGEAGQTFLVHIRRPTLTTPPSSNSTPYAHDDAEQPTGMLGIFNSLPHGSQFALKIQSILSE